MSRARRFKRVARISRWFGTRYTRLGRLLGGLTAAAAIFATDPSRTHANALLAGLFALYCVAAVNTARWHPSLVVRRRLPARAVVGAPLTYVVEITNTGPKAERALVIRDQPLERDASPDAPPDAWPGESLRENWFDHRVGYRRWLRACRWLTGATAEPTTVAEIPPGTRRSISVTLYPLRRGSVRLSAIEIARPDPLGISLSKVRIPLADDLLVLPRVHPLARLPTPARGTGRPEIAPTSPRTLVGQEFHALREYRVGDPVRHIHWRASARRGQHVVKQFDDEESSPWRILLDPYATPAGFEALIETAASLVRACERSAGGPPHLTWLAPGESAVVQGGPRDVTAMLEALALRQCSPVDTFDAVVARFPRQLVESVIFVTACWTASRNTFAAQLLHSPAGARVIIIGETAEFTADEPTTFTRLRPAHLAADLGALTLVPDPPR